MHRLPGTGVAGVVLLATFVFERKTLPPGITCGSVSDAVVRSLNHQSKYCLNFNRYSVVTVATSCRTCDTKHLVIFRDLSSALVTRIQKVHIALLFLFSCSQHMMIPVFFSLRNPPNWTISPKDASGGTLAVLFSGAILKKAPVPTWVSRYVSQ